MWGLVLGQDETYSDTKYDVPMGVNQGHSKLNSRAEGKLAEFKLKFECSHA